MLTLHFANRQEALADLLTQALGRPGGHPFTPAEVIVPSMAMRRAVTLQVAQRFGVCANVRFSFLAQWLWEQGARVLTTAAPGTALPSRTADSAQAPWQPTLLAWRVLAALDDSAWLAAHPRLAGYVALADPVTRLDLAQRLASLVDQHITYRPDWLAAWSAGRSALPGAVDADEAWQAALWRRLQTEIGGHGDAATQVDPMAAHTFAAALARLGDDSRSAPTLARLQQAGLPTTAHVFCLPTIAPVHLALLQQLARWVDLHIHAINPCAEFWFDVVDPRRLAWLAARGKAQHLEVGHPLLAAWGQQTQSQLAALVDACGDGVVDDTWMDPAPGRSLLAALQNSILTLQPPDPASLPLDPADRSIELHVCHSLTRQLEVLHDQLLAVVAQPGAPALGDILVVVPDLDAAAPLIDAVFGTAPPQLFLPFTITGRAVSQVNPAARALLDLLALAGSRCTATAVFGLLQQPVVARRFGLDDEGLVRVHGWLLDAGVHWALDGAQRAELGLDGDPRHTWADALERLFLGHALPADATPVDGRWPAGEAEGSAALALGGLWAFVQALDQLRRQTATPPPAQHWPGLLLGLVDTFLHPAEAGADALADLRAAVQGLAGTWRQTVPTLPLALDLARQALQQALDDAALGGVPTGRITFSAMPSLRGLPYRMVCVLGLDDGAFPAPHRPAEFDLIARHPRAGDRQRRQDERNLFLDLLLAARERLYLSHTGRSVRDNSPLPPSVLVSELLDLLVPALDAPRSQALAHLVVEHPLQAFDSRGFQADGDPRLRSFHGEYAAALAAGQAAKRALVLGAGDADAPADDEVALDDGTQDGAQDSDEDAVRDTNAPVFFPRPLPPAVADPATAVASLGLSQLQRFFRHPARWLLQQRLGLQLRAADEALADDEPFLPDHTARDELARHLLPQLLQAARDGRLPSDADLRTLATAGTRLPSGAIGSSHLQTELPLLRAHAQAVAAATAAPLLPPHSVTLDIDVPVQHGGPDDGGLQPWQLAVAFTDLRADGLLRHRYADPRVADHLDAWLEHLALCACAPAGVAGRTRWLGRSGTFGYRPVDDPMPLLAQLLALFARGQRLPLPFFPRTAWAWLDKGRSLGAARATWVATPMRPYAEQADAFNRLAWRGLPDPLDAQHSGLADFEAVGAAVLQPLRDHLDTDAA